MINDTNPDNQPANAPAPSQAAASQGMPNAGQAAPGQTADAQASAGQMTLAVAEAAIGALQNEVAELKDRLLRTHADMDNMRKRTEKEKADAHKYAVTKFARDMVEVGDNFQRAIETVPAGAAEQDPALKSFLDGVTMTERELINTLERHGIKRLDPKGQPFNPHLHQAVMEMQNPEVPAGTVTQVYQVGYMIEDRVLRPAMVVVAKGGAKSARTAEAATDPFAGGAENDAANPGGNPGATD